MLTSPTHLSEPSRERQGTTDALLRRWHDEGDPGAREALVGRFMPLARRLANRYRSPHEPIDDLVQVAAVGLLGAIDRFDPDREIPFPSFAIPTMLGELKRYFRDTGWSVHVPRGAQEMALQVARAAEQITSRSGRQPHLQDLAEYLELSPEEIVNALDAGNAHYAASLDAPLAGSDLDEPQTLIDTLSHTDGGYGLVENDSVTERRDDALALPGAHGATDAARRRPETAGHRGEARLLPDAGVTAAAPRHREAPGDDGSGEGRGHPRPGLGGLTLDQESRAELPRWSRGAGRDRRLVGHGSAKRAPVLTRPCVLEVAQVVEQICHRAQAPARREGPERDELTQPQKRGESSEPCGSMWCERKAAQAGSCLDRHPVGLVRTR